MWIFYEITGFQITALPRSVFQLSLKPVPLNDCSLFILTTSLKGTLILFSLGVAPSQVVFFHVAKKEEFEL